MAISPAHQAVIDRITATTGFVRSATAAFQAFRDSIQEIKDKAVEDGATVEELSALLDTELAEQAVATDEMVAAMQVNPE